jgi:hypothetical protein
MIASRVKGRARRREQYLRRRRFERRTKFLEHVYATVPPEALSPAEAAHLLIGGSAKARATFKRVSRRQFIANFKDTSPVGSENRGGGVSAPRPAWVLSRLNRSPVFPPLVPPKVDIKLSSVAEILSSLRLMHPNSPPTVLLDVLATASGLSFECCAEILLASNLIERFLDAGDVAATRSAREFWNRYEQGRPRYFALVRATSAQQFRGDWAYFDEEELAALLPGIIIPTNLKRWEYITNYVRGTDYSSVDVYSGSNMAPLFQHRFLERFNPLVFGKPPSSR